MTGSKARPMGEIHQVVAALLMKYGAEKTILFASLTAKRRNFTILLERPLMYDISEINSGTEFYNTMFSEGIGTKAEKEVSRCVKQKPVKF